MNGEIKMTQALNQQTDHYLETSEAYLEQLKIKLTEQKQLRHSREMTEVDMQIESYHGFKALLREQSLLALQAEGLTSEPAKSPVKKARRAYNFA
jgi:RNase adaptor protein for sRNA GlmZ degradation